jgi:hypothetical protein
MMDWARIARRIVLGVTAAMALLAGNAAASFLYVAPGAPASDPCSQQTPCSFDYAVNAKAQAGDTVVVAPGTYTSAGALSTPANVTIEGPTTGPLPEIDFTGGSVGLVVGNRGRLIGVKLVAVQAGQEGVLFRGGGLLDRVDVRADTTACGFDDGGTGSPDYSLTIQTSLCESISTFGVYGSIASHVGVSLTLHEDTLVGAGAGSALHVAMAFAGNVTLYDTIAYARHPGTAACSVGLQAPSGSDHLIFTTTNSNYTTSSSGSCETNASNITATETAQQTTTPTFVNDVDDLTVADYHEAPSSVTINGGATALVQDAVDLDGHPHVVDNSVDIGAYEFPSPTVTALAPTELKATAVTLHAMVDGHGRDTSNTFTYGSSSVNDNILDAINLPGSTSPQEVSATISGLTPGTSYGYQLCSLAATNACGAILHFKTPPQLPALAGVHALALKQTSAILAGSVNPGNGATNVRFEYGPTAKYGSFSNVISLGPRLTAVPVSVQIPGLKPGVRYHARLLAQNLAGTTTSPEFTFTTRSSNAFTIVAKSISKGGTIKLRLRAPDAGRFLASARAGKLRYGSASVKARGAGTVIVLIKPTKQARRTLAGRRHVQIAVAVKFTPPATTSRTRKVKLTLRP